MNISQSCLQECNLHYASLLLTWEFWVLKLYVLLIQEAQAELHGSGIGWVLPSGSGCHLLFS